MLSQRQRAELSGVGVVWTVDLAGVGEDVKDTAQGLMCKQGRQRMGYPQCGRGWVPTVCLGKCSEHCDVPGGQPSLLSGGLATQEPSPPEQPSAPLSLTRAMQRRLH